MGALMKSMDVIGRTAGAALGLFVLGVLLTSAHAGTPPQTEADPASVAADRSREPLAARFVGTRREPDKPAVSNDWFFVRSSDRIETSQRDYAEIWERDDQEAVIWKRVFHGDRKVIEYTTGQLKAERRLKDWSALATILDPRALAALELRESTRVLEQPARRYQGRWGDEQVEVVWLTRQSIPAKIVRSNREGTYILELKDLRVLPDAAWPLVSETRVSEYEIIDGADLGDREYDPFVRKVLAMDGGGQGGHSHAH